MLERIEREAARAARRTALGAGALIALLSGAAFLTLAAWIALVRTIGPLQAALVIGLAHAGLGLVLAGLAGSGRPRQTTQPRPHTSDFPPLTEAFLAGLETGRRARPDRRR
ncbi:MAG: phage holin family protein [Paracoccaceae bacterium]